MIKLIVSDMDGTLLNEQVGLSAANVAAIKDAQAAGIDFVIATGRSFKSGYTMAEEKGITCPFIGQNGATYYNDQQELQYVRGLAKDDVRKMMEIFDQTPIYYELITFDGPYTNDKQAFIDHAFDTFTDINQDIDEEAIRSYITDMVDQNRINFVESYNTLLEDDDQIIFKIAVFSTSGSNKLEKVQKRLEKEIDNISITASSRKNMEINHIRASKGQAVSEYAKLKGYKPSEVLTIGDNINDLSMLDWADYGTAMANAVPEAKAVAKYQTKSNSQDGVAHIINLVLKGEIDQAKL